MKTIVVSVTNDLVTDQRVAKVCNTLQTMGFNIHLIGRKLKNSLPITRPYKVTRMKLLFTKGPLFYAEYNVRLFLLLLFVKKDVLLANDLDTLLSNFLVSKFLQKTIVYDSHELFTEVPELIHRPSVQKIWLTIEQYIFPKLKHVFTVSNSIVNYYEQKYGVNVLLLRNFPMKHVEEKEYSNLVKKFIGNKKALIYQGAINLGRGIELMIDVVKEMDNVVLLIAGDGDIQQEIIRKIEEEELTSKVIVLGRVEPKELKSITKLCNLGLSLEEDMGMNYKYALPNKIFDYIHAEIPVLVSNLPEMKKIIGIYNVGEVVVEEEVVKIREQINRLLTTDFLEELQTAKEDLCWEKESEVIKKVYSPFL